MILRGFPGSSAGKKSACNAGDPGLIPGLGRSAGERKKLPTPVIWPQELVHGVTKSKPELSDLKFPLLYPSKSHIIGEALLTSLPTLFYLTVYIFIWGNLLFAPIHVLSP